MSEELQDPEGGGVQDEITAQGQETSQEVEQKQEQTEQEQAEQQEKIFLPIFIKKFDDYEIVEIGLDNIVINKMNITLDSILYQVEVNLKLKDIIDIFRNISSKKDYIEAIKKVNPGILDVDALIRSNNEDDP